jgi:hypothetical protein
MAWDQGAEQAATAPDRQRVRDEIDNDAIRQAWLTWVGSLPEAAAGRVSRGEVFYSALDLAEHLIAPDELSGWRINLTSEGGPYSATLILCNQRTGGPSEISASHPESLTLAFLSAIDRWAEARARPSAARYATIAEPN